MISLLTPVILLNLIMEMIGAFQCFVELFVIIKGGPSDAAPLWPAARQRFRLLPNGLCLGNGLNALRADHGHHVPIPRISDR